MKNGLISNYCYDVLQDKRGYIWVATLNGLSRFNGNKWQTFQQQSINPGYQLPANWVMDLDEDHEGNIWINTDRGIAKYDVGKDSVMHFTNPANGWGKLACVENGVFISSWSGINQYSISGRSLVLQKHYTKSERNSFPCLFLDNRQQLWACPEDNPSLMSINFRNKNFEHYKAISTDGKLKSFIINSVSPYTTDTLLLNTKSDGLLKYCIKSHAAKRFLGDCLTDAGEINCSILYKIKGVPFLLVGTKNNGLYSVNLKTHQVFHYRSDHNDPGSILSDNVTAICADDNEGVWIATSKGLSFFHPSLQKNKYYYFYNNPVMPPGILINCVYKIDDAFFLIGTDHHGLFLHNGVTKATEKISASVNLLKITSFCRINKNEVLVSTGKGLYQYSVSNHSFKTKLVAGKPFLYNMLNVKLLSPYTLGLCTYNGVMLYDLKQNRVLYTELADTNSQDEHKISKDLYLKENKLWILRLFNGYEQHHLFTGAVKELTPKEFIGKPVDYHGFSSDSKLMYISTSSGIIVQDLNNSNHVSIIKTAQGLQGDETENVLFFNRNCLYYTTPEGLFVFDPKTRKSNRVVSYENYPQKWSNQLSLSEDSLLIYTISDYFMVNDPFLTFKNTKSPAYQVEQILVNGKPQKKHADTLILAYHQNNIVLKLAGLVYPESEKNTWYFQLDKLDTLQKAVTNGEIILNNLPPDHYKLSMYSVNNEGARSAESKQICIIINKPFYNTWWFYMILILVTGTGLYFLFAYRHAQRERLVKIRNQISRDLHDELGANVSSIHIMAKMLLNKQHVGSDDTALVNISRYSVQISDTINDIVWNVNPKFDSVDELIKKMIRYASESLDAAQINYKIELPQTSFNVEIDNELKYHVYLLFKEAVNNAAKYSKANLVVISVNFTNRVFSFSVKDNGIGFDTAVADTGNGLYNMRSRAKEMKASLIIQSSQNKGTEVKLTVKLT